MKIRVAVITASTTGYAGKREDISGAKICEIVEEAGMEVTFKKILPDDRETLAKVMAVIADSQMADLILTTGGTGFSKTDCTPEATTDICERLVPGIPEAMRAASMKYAKRAMLSRAAAGIRKETLIINLPGSPKAVEESLAEILEEVIHGVEILTGQTAECARK